MRISDWSSDVCSSDLQDLPARDQARLQVLFAEYLQRLAFTIDIPESLASRARFELARNEPAAAEQDLLAALRLAPKLEGALLHLADLYRVTGRDDLGEPLLQREAAAYPDSAYRSEEHTSELKSLMRISYDVSCW